MDLLTLSSIAGGFAGALVVIGGAIRFIVHPLRKLLRDNEEFRSDWYGSVARAGRLPVPGVPERLTRIEAEFAPDHGGSLKDAVTRIEHQLADHIAHHTEGTTS